MSTPARPSNGTAPDAAPAASPPPPNHTLVVRGNLQNDLFRLGVVPCAAVAPK